MHFGVHAENRVGCALEFLAPREVTGACRRQETMTLLYLLSSNSGAAQALPLWSNLQLQRDFYWGRHTYFKFPFHPVHLVIFFANMVQS